MKRISSSPLWLALCPLLLLWAGANAHSAPKPNILFILADDLGINDLACYGRKDHNTPNLDRLATEGTRFTCAYVAQPICSPSRASIMSGKAPARLHLTTYLPGRPDCVSQKLLHPIMRQQLPLEEKTLPEYLKLAGYTTACIGKWHLGNKGFGPLEQGFDFYHPGKAVTTPSETEGGKGEYDLTATAEKFIETNRNGPFFVYLAHNSPHIPYSAKTNLVANNSSALEPVYAAVIETLDDTVGRLLAKLERLNLSSNTLVIFTSDNGGLHVPEGRHQRVTHNTPFRAGKGFLYEGGLRVPLIVRWPGRVPSGRTVPEPIINTEWLATLLELAGQPVPKNLDRESVAKVLLGADANPNRWFCWHFPHYNNQGGRPAGAIREGDWKLIEHYEDGRLELFDLKRDPSETTDVAEKEPALARRLQQVLAAWRVAVGAQTNSVNPNFDPAKYAPIYTDIDISKFNAAQADDSLFQRVQAWRKNMNSVVPR